MEIATDQGLFDEDCKKIIELLPPIKGALVFAQCIERFALFRRRTTTQLHNETHERVSGGAEQRGA